QEFATYYVPSCFCFKLFNKNNKIWIFYNNNLFEGLIYYPSPEPIFTHKNPCEVFTAVSEFPELIRRLPLVFEAYGKASQLFVQERVRGADAEESTKRLFQQPGPEYIHVRNEEAGCFIAQVDRVQVEVTDRELVNSVLTCLC